MKTARFALVGGALLVAAACGIKPRPVAPQDNGTLITRSEIERTGARTMWEALSRTVKYVRFDESGRGTPRHAGRRGTSSIVLSDDVPIFIDRVRVQQIQVLASLPARDIESILVLNGLEATTYFGTNSGDGAILIQTLDGLRH